ncbi:hypothetical protein [Taylorella equigenitalis]|uniref:hypothetical protein n=1 Tax=Taylorella equigenitalis TaxID=29575 RepID=UPI00237D159B|nr:hypothetical protein [Taylorella equigenitalis]WDU54974.1 hypothetical protein KPZ19_00700 [Taylorella equigenitalis]
MISCTSVNAKYFIDNIEQVEEEMAFAICLENQSHPYLVKQGNEWRKNLISRTSGLLDSSEFYDFKILYFLWNFPQLFDEDRISKKYFSNGLFFCKRAVEQRKYFEKYEDDSLKSFLHIQKKEMIEGLSFEFCLQSYSNEYLSNLSHSYQDRNIQFDSDFVNKIKNISILQNTDSESPIMTCYQKTKGTQLQSFIKEYFSE